MLRLQLEEYSYQSTSDRTEKTSLLGSSYKLNTFDSSYNSNLLFYRVNGRENYGLKFALRARL